MIELNKIPHKLQRRVEGVEHVAAVVRDDVGVDGDPVGRAVGAFYPVGHAGEHLAEPLAGGLVRVGGQRGADAGIVILKLTALELADKAAEHEPGQILAVQRGIGAPQHGAPAVAENEVGKLGIVGAGDVVQAFFILQIGHVAAGMRVAQRAAVIAGLAVADMIVGVDDEARGLKLAYHVQIAA